MSNELAGSSSPYLLMHADDPVNWRAWTKETLRTAKELNKLIFLSIGYSSCHWCHVMHDESFVDSEIAKILNDHYIAVKVDREERPDLDAYFMKVSQVINGNGGWPLNVILLPDGRPVFAMTYVPKEDRNGMTGLKTILIQLSQMYIRNPQQFDDQAKAVIDALEERSGISAKITESIGDRLYELIARYLDFTDGGFSGQTKFYNTPVLEFLIERYEDRHDDNIKRFLETTLKTIAIRGVHDPLFGGFFRYSTDSMWIIPHFEKMTYTQAQLMKVYTKMFLLFKDQFYVKMIDDIYNFMDRYMYDGEAYYTAMDADYKGVEGGHYLFRYDDIKALLGDTFPKFTSVYDINVNGNFSDPFGQNRGMNFLYFSGTYNEFDDLTQSRDVQEALVIGMSKLRSIKEGDDVFIDRKKLVDMNAMMISALTWAYRSTSDARYLKRASDLSSWIIKLNEGSVVHGLFNGKILEIPTIQDYAFLSQAMIDMFETTFDETYLEKAKNFAKKAMVLIKDGKLAYSSEITDLDPADGEIESSYAVFVRVLDEISLLTDDIDLHDTSDGLIRNVFGNVISFPAAYPSMVRSAEFHRNAKHVYSELPKIEEIMHRSLLHNAIFSVEESKNYNVCGYGMCYPPSETVEEVLSRISS
ncbi:hypothetical protein DMB44_05995 [Thermoplasma sp. Kam2015]|uniref:thioredoxin domain-containing protein n=1 Tax=Thermoplasma sp. Kam2015 TaxID=2094122 RepID=UPI000D8E17CA|nr:thioredoxin domain-containing protein [Thermoplasma sp. Kam2015]PYB68050.1 hypothetical protein DMB44_05995 [Thermoplasma sp. Kam2015]